MLKKRTKLIILLFLAAMILSSCTMIPATRLESMFRTGTESSFSNGSTAADRSKDTDMISITKEDYELFMKFSDLFSIYKAANEYFYQDTDPGKMVEYATKGLMSGLDDPYSFYYNPKEFAEMWEEDEGNYVGIGVLIQSNLETQICTIIRVFDGGPAQEAGVLRGDILYKVGDDLFVNASNLQEAVDIMRGEPDTDVDVTFLRNGEEITYTITRRQVNVNQVESKLIDPSIGYIALHEFAGRCDIEFEHALNDLVSKGAEGIVIDLRDNQGGWVDQARYIADLFMDEGRLCYLQFRDGPQEDDEYRTYNGKTDVKLVILINENSASSSEILTGALRDCAGAVTVGVKSFGKGIIQGVYPVGNQGAGYQMTIAQYFTPNGSAIHKLGITPDYEVPLPEGDNGMYAFADTVNDIQLKKAVEVMNDLLQ